MRRLLRTDQRLLGALCVLLVLVALGVHAAQVVWLQPRADRARAATAALADVNASMTDQQVGALGFLLSGTPVYAKPYAAGAERYARSLERLQSDLRAIGLAGHEAAMALAAGTWRTEWADPAMAGVAVEGARGRKLFDDYQDEHGRLANVISDDVSGADALVGRVRLAGTLAGIALAASAWLYLVRRRRVMATAIVAPLEEMAGVARALESGATAPTLSRPRLVELQAVADGLDGLGASLAHRAELEAEIRQLAFTDALTGLPNRRRFLERLIGDGHPIPRRSVAFVDLDHFKTVNDQLGHDAGDQLLLDVARALTSTVSPPDLAARLGGDEFAILLEGPDDAGLLELGDRLTARLRFPRTLPDGRVVVVTASIGVARADDRSPVEDVLRLADAAMYRAKQLGRDRIVFHPPIPWTARHPVLPASA